MKNAVLFHLSSCGRLCCGSLFFEFPSFRYLCIQASYTSPHPTLSFIWITRAPCYFRSSSCGSTIISFCRMNSDVMLVLLCGDGRWWWTSMYFLIPFFTIDRSCCESQSFKFAFLSLRSSWEHLFSKEQWGDRKTDASQDESFLYFRTSRLGNIPTIHNRYIDFQKERILRVGFDILARNSVVNSICLSSINALAVMDF